MRFIYLIISLILTLSCFSQKALPLKMYATMRDSTTSIDVVLYHGKGGSLSMEGRNVHVFNSFFENKTAAKNKVESAGTIMWQINGREYLSGNLFLGDSTGYVVIKKDEKEYINSISKQGNSFFKNQLKN